MIIDPQAALAAGSLLVRPGPLVPAAQAAREVARLREASVASVDAVAAVTGLPGVPGEASVIDRRTWVGLNARLADELMDAASPARRRPGPWQRAAQVGGGVQAGLALGALSGRVLGQFLPLADEPRLVLVAPNVVDACAALGADPDDFALWVCLHEQTHRLQFAAAPWLRAHLIGRLRAFLDADAARPWLRAGTELGARSLMGVASREAFDEIGAFMALLEGYADVMMDRVGPGVVPSVATIRRAFDARRSPGGWRELAQKASGVELKVRQYRDGAAFCSAVIERVGTAGLNRVWDAPSALPTPGEIADPVAWVDRVCPGWREAHSGAPQSRGEAS